MKDEVIIGGVKYVPANDKAETLDGMKYVIIRTYSAGVFAGYLEKKENQNVILRRARRIWEWVGAATLSQLAVDGVSNPNECKFPCEVDKIEIDQVIEVIDCTKKAKDSIAQVQVWEA